MQLPHHLLHPSQILRWDGFFQFLDDIHGLASVTVQVRLKPGNNVVRMGSPYCWAPDIDCFTLKKIE